MKHMFFIAILLCWYLCVSVFGFVGPQDIVSHEIGIDASSGREISFYDTHEGFHGDGTAFIALEFSDEGLLSQIAKDERWQALPLDGTAEALVYGISSGPIKVGPYVCGEKGRPLMPYVRNGYYIFTDRYARADDGRGILSRGSFNFTLCIYDLTSDILYFCKVDT